MQNIQRLEKRQQVQVNDKLSLALAITLLVAFITFELMPLFGTACRRSQRFPFVPRSLMPGRNLTPTPPSACSSIN